MQHFRHNFEGYLSNQILNVPWSEFQEGLLNVSNLDRIWPHYTLSSKLNYRGIVIGKTFAFSRRFLFFFFREEIAKFKTLTVSS